MLSSDFLFPRFFVVPLANPSNFSHCKCFSSRIILWILKIITSNCTSACKAQVTVTRHRRVIIISIHGIMHLLLGNKMQVESAHAQHAVALSTRRMRSNKTS